MSTPDPNVDMPDVPLTCDHGGAVLRIATHFPDGPPIIGLEGPCGRPAETWARLVDPCETMLVLDATGLSLVTPEPYVAMLCAKHDEALRHAWHCSLPVTCRRHAPHRLPGMLLAAGAIRGTTDRVDP